MHTGRHTHIYIPCIASQVFRDFPEVKPRISIYFTIIKQYKPCKPDAFLAKIKTPNRVDTEQGEVLSCPDGAYLGNASAG